MGESGPRRSTLVSRLPIFRRSSSKRQESLPSSPSSGGVGNGVHTSSPSSTNSSSSSTGKRRSLFRAPSLSFSSKRNSDPPALPVNLNLTPPPQGSDANGNEHVTNPTPALPEASRTKARHSFGFGGHRSKKITRSQTEDFDKVSSSSSTANRNVFINCISSGTNEGDDSGYLEDYSGGSKRSAKQKKQLLPKSFSAHHRFSRHSEHRKAPDVNLEPPTTSPTTPGEGLTPASLPGELLGVGCESSLQSPMISEDRTTAVTPSEFVPVTEDSMSEVDALLAPSPSPGPAPGQDTVSASPPAPEHFSLAISTSQVFFTPAQSSAERPLLPDTSTANTTDYETAASLSEPDTAMPCSPPPQQSQEARKTESSEERKKAREDVSEVGSEVEERKGLVERSRGYQTETTSESEVEPGRRDGCNSNPEQSDSRATNILSVQEAGRASCYGRHEPRSSHLKKPHTNSMCSSVSPYHGVVCLERRLRSSSEGAGGPPMQPRHRDSPGTEGYSLLKHRTNSSSSKLGSLDVMSNLGSSELDEDDLMLDLDLSDDQRQRHVSREDSSQSLTLLPSPIEICGDRIPGKESKNFNHRELSRPTSLLPADWPLGLGKDEEPLPPGLEALPLGRMQQDCTAVKTLLLRLRRTLQESTETSPASSLHSLPISPCSEKSILLKDPAREDVLLQQLREKDELILRLQTELECAKAAMKPTCQKTDRTTQTEPQGPDPIHAGRSAGQSSSSSSSSFQRERRPLRSLAVDHANLYGHCIRPASERHCLSVLAPSMARTPGPILAQDQTPAPGSSPAYIPTPAPSPNPSRVLSPILDSAPAPDSVPSTSRQAEKEVSWLKCGATGGLRSHIPRPVGAASSCPHSRSSPCPSLSSDSERGPPTPPPPPSSLHQPSSTSSSSSSSSSSSLFAGRLGQPPRGPLSLHMYSRKNVFLHHSLHTAELQALAQHDS